MVSRSGGAEGIRDPVDRIGALAKLTQGRPGHAMLVLRTCQQRITSVNMRSLTVRLPEALVAQIEAESRERKLSKSDVVRERLTGTEKTHRPRPRTLDAIADLIGSVEGPPDLGARKKHYLKVTGYGRKRHR